MLEVAQCLDEVHTVYLLQLYLCNIIYNQLIVIQVVSRLCGKTEPSSGEEGSAAIQDTIISLSALLTHEDPFVS